MSIENWLHLGHEARYLCASIQDFSDSGIVENGCRQPGRRAEKSAAQAALQTHPATEKRACRANF